MSNMRFASSPARKLLFSVEIELEPVQHLLDVT